MNNTFPRSKINNIIPIMSPSKNQPNLERMSHRVAGIDILRGLSIISVILLHINIRIPLSKFFYNIPKALEWTFLWSGFYGVSAFFVISGYLITTKSYDRWGNIGDVKLLGFYINRFSRIIPGLIFLLIIMTIFNAFKVPGFTLDPHQVSLSRAWWEALTFHINMFQAHWGDLPATWNALWSLSIEEAFYIGFPLLCLALRKEKLIISALCIFVVVAPFARIYGIHETDPQDQTYLCCMDGLAIGCLAAILQRRFQFNLTGQLSLFAFGFCLFALVDIFRVQTSRWGLVSTGTYITVLTCGVAFMLVAIGSGLGANFRIPGVGIISRFGKLSYEIYLTHTFITMTALGIYDLIKPKDQLIPVIYFFVISTSLFIGVYYERLITGPSNRYLREKLTMLFQRGARRAQDS